MRERIPKLCLIVPCYNEEQILPVTSQLFLKKINQLENEKKIDENSRILFVNDGSTDNTWDIIKNLSEKNSKFYGISQSRNRGHQKALIAGYDEVKNDYDIAVSIDCDGQDDINAIELMIDCYKNGCEIVYGVRKDRSTDTFLKKAAAEMFYKILKFLGAEIISNHADYRLVSCKVLKELEKYGEVNVFLRGLFPLVGFKSTAVYYDRKSRMAGKSKYSFKRMLLLASDGITGFSSKPIHFVFISGIVVFLSGVLWLIYLFLSRFITGNIDYYMTGLGVFVLFGGIQLLSVGIIGEYIGKIYLEVKKRPRYIISERTEEIKCEKE